MTFYNWLKNISDSDTPEGDFARDAFEDCKFSKSATEWSDIENYLSHTIADEAVINAAKSAFDLYEEDKHHQN